MASRLAVVGRMGMHGLRRCDTRTESDVYECFALLLSPPLLRKKSFTVINYSLKEIFVMNTNFNASPYAARCNGLSVMPVQQRFSHCG